MRLGAVCNWETCVTVGFLLLTAVTCNVVLLEEIPTFRTTYRRAVVRQDHSHCLACARMILCVVLPGCHLLGYITSSGRITELEMMWTEVAVP